MSRQELIDGGWFGPVVSPPVAARLGDVALIAKAPISFVDAADSGPYPLVCRHGSLTSAEMLVPLLAATALNSPQSQRSTRCRTKNPRPTPNSSAERRRSWSQPQESEQEQIETVTAPAKVMRIGSMVKQLLEEVRTGSLDEASRERLAEIYERSIVELSEALSPDLQEELRMLALPFKDGVIPSDGELRVAKAQLVGWLEGLFHGIQATLFAQQIAARQQLEQMRQLPPGAMAGRPRRRTDAARRGHRRQRSPGTYL